MDTAWTAASPKRRSMGSELEIQALINKQRLPASELGYGLGYAGVRVYVGYEMSNPYPNPNKTRRLTPGFSVPVTIPTPYSRRTQLDAQFIALPLVTTLLLKAPGMWTFGYLFLDNAFVSACEIVGTFRPQHTISYLVPLSHLVDIKLCLQVVPLV